MELKNRTEYDNRDVVPNEFESVPIPDTENYIYKKILERIHERDKNYIGVVLGEPGTGKSWAAIRMAEILDPTFSNDRIIFPPMSNLLNKMKQYKKKDKMRKGMFWVLDEGGVAASNRRWYTDANIYFNYILQSFRKLNQGLLITLPHLNLLDNQSKQFRNGTIILKRKGEAIYFKNYVYETTGEVHRTHFKKEGEKIKGIHFKLPQYIDMEKYEKRKDEFLENIMTDQIQEANISKQEKLLKKKEKVQNNIEKYKYNDEISVEIIRIEEELAYNDARYIKQKIIKELN